MRLKVITPLTIRDRFGVIHKQGDVFEIRDDIAEKYIRLGRAEPAPEPEPEPVAAPVIETAAVEPSENTAKRTGRPKTRRKSTS